MKIQPVSYSVNYNKIQKNNNRQNINYYTLPQQDSVSFSGLRFFSRRPEFKDEQEEQLYANSAEIKNFIHDLYLQNKDFKKIGKEHLKTLKQFIALGAEYNYEGYILLNEKRRQKLLFGFDETTKMPNAVSLLRMDEGFSPILTYRFTDNVDSFAVEITNDPEVKINIELLGDKVVYYKETDKSGSYIREMAPYDKNKFYYIVSTQDKQGQPDETKVEVYFDYKDSSKSYFVKPDDNDELVKYVYNCDKDIWIPESLNE